MPTFVYRAVNEKGTIVRNRVEDINKKSLIRKLKNNNLDYFFMLITLYKYVNNFQ